MIVLDTHIWIWFVQRDPRLGDTRRGLIQAHEDDGLGIPSISLWEVAKAVELGRLTLPQSVEDWFALALAYPGMQILPLVPEIAVESTRLPGEFHKDPFDQINVATARIHAVPLVTTDGRILKYSHVKLLP